MIRTKIILFHVSAGSTRWPLIHYKFTSFGLIFSLFSSSPPLLDSHSVSLSASLLLFPSHGAMSTHVFH